MQESSELYERIRIVEAKEVLGISLSDYSCSPIKGKSMMETEAKYNVENGAVAIATAVDYDVKELADININLLKLVKRQKEELQTADKKYKSEIQALKQKLEKQENRHERELEVAKNEKSTNLQIRKIVDALPGTHYQLDEKIEILDSLVNVANTLYDLKAYYDSKESLISINYPSGKYSLKLLKLFLDKGLLLHYKAS